MTKHNAIKKIRWNNQLELKKFKGLLFKIKSSMIHFKVMKN